MEAGNEVRVTTRTVDILMITYNRPEYTRLSLRRLLSTCDKQTRVWIWHNGQHEETLAVVRSFLGHQCIHEFHHSPENQELTEPTNWLWKNSTASFVSKVDDDCLVPEGWVDMLRRAHSDEPRFGVLGCWRFMDEDFEYDRAAWKIRTYQGGYRVLQNCWVEGSGYLMKRECLRDLGLLKGNMSFTQYCKRLAARGWINGWLYPFVRQEHMDDPRSTHCALKSDADLLRQQPLTAKRLGIRTLEDWVREIRQSALDVQSASLDPYDVMGIRAQAKRALSRLCLTRTKSR